MQRFSIKNVCYYAFYGQLKTDNFYEKHISDVNIFVWIACCVATLQVGTDWNDQAKCLILKNVF